MKTADDFLRETLASYLAKNLNSSQDRKNAIEEAMISFADYHVRRALEKANKEARIITETGNLVVAFFKNNSGDKTGASISKHSITNSYPKSKFIL